MVIPETVVNYIMVYGYLAIFVMVFLQETGFPNPLPNEILLLFSGYLCYKGYLIIYMVIATVVLADFAGTNILYHLFYHTGIIIKKKMKRWLPGTHDKLEKLTKRVDNGNLAVIFIFRCTPFTRGYISVIAGFLRIHKIVYLPMALLTAILWASFYVISGYLAGPFWNLLTRSMPSFRIAMVVLIAAGIVILLVRKIMIRTGNSLTNISG